MKLLTIEQKIGQLIMVGFDGYSYNDHIKTLIDNHIGNVILFSRNYQNPNQLQTLTKQLHSNILKNTGMIPFIAIDEEGGPVTRLTNPFIIPPSQMTTAGTSFPDASYYVGKMIAKDLFEMGINVNFAPCLDLNPKLENETGHVRSYGEDPYFVSSLAKRFIDGTNEHNVLCTLKHFPGEGDTLEDTHLNLPVLTLSKEEIKNHNMLPFIYNLNAPFIMASHILFKDYDNVPISLSKNVLTNLLRNELHYQGLIITDCLEMNAIQNHYGTEKAAVMSLKAGSDIILVSQTKSIQEAVIKSIKDAINNNELTIEEIDKKIERINIYKSRLKPFIKSKEYKTSNYYLNIMKKIVYNSITLVKGNNIKINSQTKFIIGLGNYRSIVEEKENIDLVKVLKEHFNNEIIDIDDYKEENNDVVLFLNNSFNYEKQIKEIIKRNNTSIITFKGPMIIKKLKGYFNLVTMYEYTPLSIEAIIKYLKGKQKAYGILPLSYPNIIDSHIHFSFPHSYFEIEEALNLSHAKKGNLVAQIDSNKASDTIDCLYAKYLSKNRLYTYGSLDATLYLKDNNMGNNLIKHIEEIMACGCDGIKMLEGKPDQRKQFKIPSFDNEEWDKVFSYLEQKEINIIWHVNDPEEFWDINKIPTWAKASGWYYDETFINNEKQYQEVYNVLDKHPLLHITFAHFFFMSNQLDRLDTLLTEYPNVCIDITPGVELFENLSNNIEEAKTFFTKYQDRIIYGTDISRCYYDNNYNENIIDTYNRSKLCFDFLTKSQVNIQLNKHSLLGNHTLRLNGLMLDKTIVNKILYQNFLNRNKNIKPINTNNLINEIDKEIERIKYLNEYFKKSYDISILCDVKENLKKSSQM